MFPPTRRINYSQVMTQVSKIRALSKKTDGVAATFESAVNDLMRVWEGEASKAFDGQCDVVTGKIRTTSRKINDIADRISSAAADIDREDREAEEQYREYLAEQERNRRLAASQKNPKKA